MKKAITINLYNKTVVYSTHDNTEYETTNLVAIVDGDQLQNSVSSDLSGMWFLWNGATAITCGDFDKLELLNSRVTKIGNVEYTMETYKYTAIDRISI